MSALDSRPPAATLGGWQADELRRHRSPHGDRAVLHRHHPLGSDPVRGRPRGLRLGAADPTATDREIAFGTYSLRRLTRLRADLPASFLDTDLELEADEAQSEILPDLTAKKYAHPEVPCPLGLDDSASAAAALSSPGDRPSSAQGGSCVVAEGGRLDPVRTPLLVALAALATILRRIRRRA